VIKMVPASSRSSFIPQEASGDDRGTGTRAPTGESTIYLLLVATEPADGFPHRPSAVTSCRLVLSRSIRRNHVKLSVRGAVAAIFILAMCALCVRLGFWQLDRLEQRRTRNAAIRAATAQPPLRLDSNAPGADPRALAWRRAQAGGRYHHAGDMVIRGRSREGRPGVHLVSPLVLADGRVVMVNRGWVPSPDGTTADVGPLRTAGPVRVTGALLPITAEQDRGLPIPGRAGTDSTWRRVDLAAARARSPGTLIPLVLQQLPAEGAGAGSPPLPEPLPSLSEGNHLSYAVQWFSFAAIGVVGLAILLLRRRKPA
jgi:surfeit locus 1 family protein